MQFHLHFNPVEILCWVELHYISSCSTDCVISSFLCEMSRLREFGRLVWSFDLPFAQIFTNRSERDGKLWQKEYVRRFGRTTGREITSNQSPSFLYGFTQLKYTNSFVSSEARLFGYSLPRALYAKTSANKIKNLTEVRWTLELKVESKKSICGAMSLFHVGCEMNSMNGWRGTTVTDEKRKMIWMKDFQVIRSINIFHMLAFRFLQWRYSFQKAVLECCALWVSGDRGSF